MRVVIWLAAAGLARALPRSGGASSKHAGAGKVVALEHSADLVGEEEHAHFSLVDVGSGDHVARSEGVPGRRLGEAIEQSTGHLRMHFKAHGESFDVDFHRTDGPISDKATVDVWKDGKWESKPVLPSAIFVSHAQQAVLRHHGGELRGAIIHKGKIFDVDGASGEKLRVRRVGAGGDKGARGAHSGLETLMGIQNASSLRATAARRLTFAPDRITPWTTCYPGDTDSAPHEIEMGIAMGQKMRELFNNGNDAIRFLEDLLIKTNMVYKVQLNIVLTLKKITIVESSSDAPSWNNPNCRSTINSQLTEFTKWAPEPLGLWHLVDDCFGTSGTIGLAYVGTLCQGYNPWNGGYVNRGVDWYSRATWLTFAHEVGHNLGAGHSFEEGQGSTGGIMDYGDGTLDGAFQFNEQYRKSQICTELTEQIDSCPYIKTLEPLCGNWMVEGDEECECDGGTSCAHCECCKLTGGKSCTPDAPHGNGQCCTATGAWETPNKICTDLTGVKGYCARGVCVAETVCAKFVSQIGPYCGVSNANDCRYYCRGSFCGDRDPIKYTSGRIANQFPDGTPCGFGGMGACSNGECNELGTWVDVDAPVEWSTASAGSAAVALEECVGYANSAFLGTPDVVHGEGGNASSLAECHAACKAAPTCRSFSFNAAEGKCEVWTPAKIDEDLAHISGWESYICAGWAVGAWFPDGDKWENRVVATVDAPDLGCANCNTGSCSEGCSAFTLAQCDTACKEEATGTCNLFVHGDKAGQTGRCELWSSKTLKDLNNPKEGDTADAYFFSCQGAGHLCKCRDDAISKYARVRINCQCDPTATSSDCEAGKYCYGGVCHDEPDDSRRLTSCAADGVDVFQGTTTNYAFVGKAVGAWSGPAAAMLVAVAAAAFSVA